MSNAIQGTYIGKCNSNRAFLNTDYTVNNNNNNNKQICIAIQPLAFNSFILKYNALEFLLKKIQIVVLTFLANEALNTNNKIKQPLDG